jgi:hypothetical protein
VGDLWIACGLSKAISYDGLWGMPYTHNGLTRAHILTKKAGAPEKLAVAYIFGLVRRSAKINIFASKKQPQTLLGFGVVAGKTT